MSAIHDVFIGLGSNLGERFEHLQWATLQLAGHAHIQFLAASSVYTSEAHVLADGDTQPAYLNAVLHVKTDLTPQQLLGVANQLEAERGRDRKREAQWASRTLDIDILAYGDMTLQSSRLQIPHRRLGVRKFVLVPWADLAPTFIVPAPFGATVSDLLERCPDTTQLASTGLVLND